MCTEESRKKNDPLNYLELKGYNLQAQKYSCRKTLEKNLSGKIKECVLWKPQKNKGLFLVARPLGGGGLRTWLLRKKTVF